MDLQPISYGVLIFIIAIIFSTFDLSNCQFKLTPTVKIPVTKDDKIGTAETESHNNKERVDLSQPIPEKCVSRPKDFKFGNHSYFFSEEVEEFQNLSLNWLNSRNVCRKRCMDLVSLEGPREDFLIKHFLLKRNVTYIWTSGRLCDFKGCNRSDLQPANINGWFWSGSLHRIASTNMRPPPGWSHNPWSHTGSKSLPGQFNVTQPDNAEIGINESCLTIMNNIYQDGITWHDAGCYYEKPFICEDSDELLHYVHSIRPDLDLFSFQ